MGKKKAFVDKKTAKRFRLVPAAASGPSQQSDPNASSSKKFVPTAEHLAEQHKFGVFFDDDYDYLQHLRDSKKDFKLQSVDPEDEEEVVVIKAPSRPVIPSMLFSGIKSFGGSSNDKDDLDDDVERALEGDFNAVDTDFPDNFVELAGGALGDNLLRHRERNNLSDDEDDDSEDDFDPEDDFDDDDDEDAYEHSQVAREGPQRALDDAFDRMLEADYHEDQMGELDGDDDGITGYLEPDDARLKRLTKEKQSLPEYDEQLAKQYIRERMRLIESGVIEDKEEDETVELYDIRKRMKWDCESFATQYTNIYNHPTVIDAGQKLSRKALKRLDRQAKASEVLEEVDEEMEEDDDDVGTVISTMSKRPKNETPEERRLRKQAVKEARRARRVEKKATKVAFAEEKRKIVKARLGQIKATPIV